jgi:hypothetical protein
MKRREDSEESLTTYRTCHKKFANNSISRHCNFLVNVRFATPGPGLGETK